MHDKFVANFCCYGFPFLGNLKLHKLFDPFDLKKLFDTSEIPHLKFMLGSFASEFCSYLYILIKCNLGNPQINYILYLRKYKEHNLAVFKHLKFAMPICLLHQTINLVPCIPLPFKHTISYQVCSPNLPNAFLSAMRSNRIPQLDFLFVAWIIQIRMHLEVRWNWICTQIHHMTTKLPWIKRNLLFYVWKNHNMSLESPTYELFLKFTKNTAKIYHLEAELRASMVL